MRPLKRRRHRGRTWSNRNKLSACTSKNFPWEVVMGFVQSHPRSLILMQMVSKGLRQQIATDHLFWQRIYAKNFFIKSYLCRSVKDPSLPDLSLWKVELTGLARYLGGLHIDRDADAAQLPAMDTLTAYIRKWHRLENGTRCGMCGCRFRHDVYWSLGMRVCRLCMAQNSVSAYEMFHEYGLEYMEVAAKARNRVFYYNLTISPTEDRVSFCGVHPSDFQCRTYNYMFWRPHLAVCYDLPALRNEQRERRRAGALLSAVARRPWVVAQRLRLGQHARCSIDCFVTAVYRNERRRCGHRYGKASLASRPSGSDWAFPEPRSVPRYTARTGKSLKGLARALWANEDSCVPV